ncbi:TPA: hypothetical protein ACKQPR_001461 [Serratia odorifera]|nr:hypothetical protein [Serratia odorifera]
MSIRTASGHCCRPASKGLVRYTNNPSSLSDVLMLLTHPCAPFGFLYPLLVIFVVATLLYKKDKFHLMLSVMIVLSAALYIYQLTRGGLAPPAAKCHKPDIIYFRLQYYSG